jgi:hypothetical protein
MSILGRFGPTCAPLFLFALLAPPVAAVPPPNDLCSGAEVIPGAGPFPLLTALTADITDATVTGDPPPTSCQINVSRSIWYSFTPTASAPYIISSCADAPTGTTVDDTVIAIYTSAGGCAGPFTEIPTGGSSDGCDDDSCSTEALQSVVTTQLNAGTTYFVVVWKFDAPAPAVGNTAVQLRVAATFPPGNDTCGTAAALILDGPVTGSTMLGSNDYQLSGAACYAGVGQTPSTAPGRDVAYSFTAPSAGSYSFRVTDVNVSNPVAYVASSCEVGAAPLTLTTCLGASNRNTTVAQASEEVTCLPLAASQTVFAFVDENVLASGSSFTIEVNSCSLETEPNGTPGTANSPSFGIEGSITPAAEADFFTLAIPGGGGRVFALVDGVAGNTTDFDLRVTSTTDTLEYDDANNDPRYGSLGPNVGGTPVTAAPAFLRVNHFTAGATGEPYRLYYVVQPPSASATVEVEPNDTTATATEALNNNFSGSLAAPAPSTDADLYRFSAAAGDLIFVSLDGDPLRNNTPVNGALSLLDSAGTALLTINDGAATSNTAPGAGNLGATSPNSPGEGFAYRVPSGGGGTFYARVAIGTTSTGASGAGDYLLSVSLNGNVGGGLPVQLQSISVE